MFIHNVCISIEVLNFHWQNNHIHSKAHEQKL